MPNSGYHQLVNGHWIRISDGTGPYTKIGPDEFVLVASSAVLQQAEQVAAIEATNAVLETVNASIGAANIALAGVDSSVDAVNASVGATNTGIGALTETAPATDTASSGLNGRLQRIAQRLTDLYTLTSSIADTRGDPLLRIGFGLQTGYERWSLWGNNPDIDTGTTPEVVSQLGSSAPTFVSGLTSMEIVSDSASDTAAGTGARTVILEVLDSNYDRSFPTVTLNGTTAVALPAQVVAVNMATVKTVGSAGANVGTLTIRNAGAGTSRIVISPGRNVTQAAVRVVPAGYTLQIRTHFASINRTVSAGRWATWTGAFQQYVSPGVWDPAVFALDVGLSDTSPLFFQAEPGLIIREKGRYWHQAMAVSANNTDLTTASWGVLRLNSAL